MMCYATLFSVTLPNVVVLMLLRFLITCELCSSWRIMQTSFYSAVNHAADLSGNRCDILERSTGHAPGS